MILSKKLSLNVQESMQIAQDEQVVNELRNQPLELDVLLRDEQLKEMEVWDVKTTDGVIASFTQCNTIYFNYQKLACME